MTKDGRAEERSIRAACLLAASIGLLGGCATIERVLGFEDQAEVIRSAARIQGRIETEGPAEGTLVVVLGRLVPNAQTRVDELIGVDSYVRLDSGTYLFVVDEGRYQVGAYEDRNRNGLLDPGEPFAPVREARILDIASGGRIEFDLRLSSDRRYAASGPMDVLELIERDARSQLQFSLWAFSVVGAVCDDLSDPRFGAEAGLQGLWTPTNFLNEEIAGIHFLEPYDARRIPVLFVHGIAGYPQQFSTLIGALDRSRFQPWFYFYPSGFSLDGVTTHLAELLTRLQVEHSFDEIAVIAHSMGGLVARGAIAKYVGETARDDIRLFVSISTPWGGDDAADRAKDAPVALPHSFQDMAPSSSFLRDLIWQDADLEIPTRLPEELAYHLIMGFHGKGDHCNDGTVACASEAFAPIQEQAQSVRAWDETHVGILSAKRTTDRVLSLLDDSF